MSSTSADVAGSAPQHRAQFDADVVFSNGGGLQVQDFRLDIPGSTIDASGIGQLLVRHLGLLMVERVEVRDLRVIEEAHKGSRGGPSDPAAQPGSGRPDDTPGRFVELSHPIREGMITYPGLPGPVFGDHLARDASRAHYDDAEFAIQRVEMVGNTGTYLDSPFHRYADGTDLAGVPLDAVVDLPAVVIRLTGRHHRAIGATELAATDVHGCAVLLHTGWDARWGSDDYGGPAPFLTADGADHLVEVGARLVGIDSVNIDDTVGRRRPAHSTLLAAGIPVVEHLTGLDRVPVSGARFTAAPPRVVGFGTFPVRAFARVPG